MSIPAGQSAARVLGTDTTVSIGGITGATGSETFLVINECSDFKNAGFKTSLATVTNFASKGIARKVATIVDFGTATFTANRIANDPGQLAVNAAQLTRQSYDFKIQLPVDPVLGETIGESIAFSGVVTEAGSFDIAIDKASQYSFTVELNSWTVTPGVVGS